MLEQRLKQRQGARRQDNDSSSQYSYPVSLHNQLPTKFRRLPGVDINPQAAKNSRQNTMRSLVFFDVDISNNNDKASMGMWRN